MERIKIILTLHHRRPAFEKQLLDLIFLIVGESAQFHYLNVDEDVEVKVDPQITEYEGQKLQLSIPVDQNKADRILADLKKVFSFEVTINRPKVEVTLIGFEASTDEAHIIVDILRAQLQALYPSARIGYWYTYHRPEKEVIVSVPSNGEKVERLKQIAQDNFPTLKFTITVNE